MKILIGIFILAVIVFVHELGHFLIARLNGIEVVEFTVGFGPKIAGWTTKHGTKISLRVILLGAACVFDDLDADRGDEDLNNDRGTVLQSASGVYTRAVPDELYRYSVDEDPSCGSEWCGI